MQSPPKIVRAKQKPIEELPDWAICCDVTRKAVEATNAKGEIWELDLSTLFYARQSCTNCGAATNKVVSVLARDRSFACALPFVDLDEGDPDANPAYSIYGETALSPG